MSGNGDTNSLGHPLQEARQPSTSRAGGTLVAKRDIGAIGENLFLSWCEPEGFHAQKSQVDRLGWDFLLESEPDRSTERPLDAQNELLKFLVQVKSTEKAGEPPRIKLSALKHLVDADLPAAIIALIYHKSGRVPDRSLFIPVDDVVITETLRRVRREEARGNRAIHRTTVPVPLERAIEIGPLGEGLGAALMGMLGDSPSEYIASKARHRQTCGFDDRAVIGHFFVPGSDAAKKISDLFLGVRRELEVSDLTIERHRFGIALENDREHFQQAVLEMNVPPLLATTIELASDAGEWTSIEAEVFIPPPFEGKRVSRVRFANNNFEVLLDFEKKWAELTFNYAGDRMVELDEAVSIIEIGAILSRPDKTVTAQFKGTKLELPVGPLEGPFHHWVHAAPALRQILSAISRSGRRLTHQIMLKDFYDWVEKHTEFLALTSTPGVNMIFPKFDNGIVDEQNAILTPFSLEFGGAQYTALIEIPIEAVTTSEKEITLIGGRPHIVADVARLPGLDTAVFFDTAIEKSKRDRKATGPALVAGGFENWQNVILSTS